MPLDGLRAWIGEVERKLGLRTRVFLVLTALAIGIGGAAMYLAIDTRQGAVSEGDVQALQEELEARIGTGGGSGLAELETELQSLQAQVEQLRGGGDGAPGGQPNGAGAGAPGGTGDGASTEPGPGQGVGGDAGADAADDVEDLLEQARERSEQDEDR